ncbi:MAG: pirin family protein [Sediminibacterium sp.]|jgi:quercetin 2,3-dioxygenase|uniref:pirin family protein n=1 Tax=Sediminibacterium sp. TaxID=1917865 RepID=UPI002ABA5C76|nr:pirin family protein [Sediminibacterium sp.]MDZ4070957.1 pirin family protein [Sediminibacterium sp.]
MAQLIKKVIQNTQLNFTNDFPGLRGVNIMAKDFAIEPFLVFTEFTMDQPVFGPHPHAGISVMTYLLPDSKGSFINRDSNGDFSTIEPGGLHITQAGSGIHHDEFPSKTGVETHGFQIWINHKEDQRMINPKAMHANASEIIQVQSEDAIISLIHGKFNHKVSSYQMVTDITLLHVFLQPEKSLQLPSQEMAFLYGLKGTGITDQQIINQQRLINYDTEGNTIEVTAGKEGLEFMFGTGIPLKENIIYGGPFVMTTAAQMQETRKRYAEGNMGHLDTYSTK